MASRCSLGHHGSCTVCGRFTSPAELGHAHEFNRRDEGHAIVCAHCYECILRAARYVLQTIRAAEIDFSTPQQLEWVLKNRIIIAAQSELGFYPDAQN